MLRAAGGDTTAFDVIVRRHQHRVQRFAIRMLGGNSAAGADIAVGSFLRLWEHRATYRPCDKLGTWLIRTAYRLCLDSLGSRESAELGLERASDATDSIEPQVHQRALALAVRDAIMELPETHRAVIILSAYEEMSYEAIGRALEIPAGTVASRRNHAIDVLRRRLAAWEEQ